MLVLYKPKDNYPPLPEYSEKSDFSSLSHMMRYANFDPKYNLIVYRFLYTDLFPNDCYREYHGKYGYSTRYFQFPDEWKVVPSFIENETKDGFIIFDKLDEFKVVRRGIAYYAYSLKENRDPARFLDNVKELIPERIEFVKKRYERDMRNLESMKSKISETKRELGVR